MFAGAAGTVDAGAVETGADGAVTGAAGTVVLPEAGAAGAAGTSAISPAWGAAVVALTALVRVAFQAMNRLMTKNAMASHLVDFDRKFDAPREPNTVPDAPAPKPEPACAPAPRCMRISAIMAIAIST